MTDPCDFLSRVFVEQKIEMDDGERCSCFFPDPADAYRFEAALRADGHRDVVLVLKKNAEDAARMGSALARVEGAHVHWTMDRA